MPERCAQTRLDRAAAALGGLATLTLIVTAVSKQWLSFIVVALFGILSAVMNLAAGVQRLRFSLRTLLVLMLAGGACGALLNDLHHPLLFALGVVGTIFLAGFVFSSVVRATIPGERLDAD